MIGVRRILPEGVEFQWGATGKLGTLRVNRATRHVHLHCQQCLHGCFSRFLGSRFFSIGETFLLDKVFLFYLELF